MRRRRRGTAVTDLKSEAGRAEQREDHDKFRETDGKTQGDSSGDINTEEGCMYMNRWLLGQEWRQPTTMITKACSWVDIYMQERRGRATEKTKRRWHAMLVPEKGGVIQPVRFSASLNQSVNSVFL